MTRYRLPEVLGGGEVTDAERDPALQLWGHPARLLRTEDGIEFVMQWRHLTEIPPPLPAEPEPGAYLIGGVLHVRVSPAPRMCWLRIADGLFGEELWADLWRLYGGPDVQIVPLIPAPDVKLPWSVGQLLSVQRLVAPGLSGGVRVAVNDEAAGISPSEAEDMAAALIAAARAARKAGAS